MGKKPKVTDYYRKEDKSYYKNKTLYYSHYCYLCGHCWVSKNKKDWCAICKIKAQDGYKEEK